MTPFCSAANCGMDGSMTEIEKLMERYQAAKIAAELASERAMNACADAEAKAHAMLEAQRELSAAVGLD